MLTLCAKQKFTYGKYKLKPGDPFPVEHEKHALVLERMQLAERLEVFRVPENMDAETFRNEFEADGNHVATIEIVNTGPNAAPKRPRGPDKKPRKRRTYKRRDMVAEE